MPPLTAMRDGSTDYETGWLYDGYYDRCAPRPAGGFAGLGSDADVVARNISMIQPSGQRYIKDALADREARPILLKLLASTWNPSAALAKQAEQDLAESVKSTGKVIVFKSLVAKLAPRIKAAQDALVSATDPKSPIGKTAVGIALTSSNPHADVREFLTNVALAAIAPDAEFVDDATAELSGLGKSVFKKIRTAAQKVVQKVEETAHNPNVRKAYIAAAVIGAVAITGGAILPALLPAASAVAGGAGGAFAKKPAATKQVWDPVRGENVTVDAATGQPVTDTSGGGTAAAGSGIDLKSIAGAALEIYKLQQTGQVAKAGVLQAQALAQLKAQGLSETQAQALVDQGLQQAAQSYGPQQQAAPQYISQPGGGGGAPAEASMFSPDMVKYGLIAVVVLGTGYGIYQAVGSGRGRSSRRR